jgi:hypothetical protein
VAGQAEIAEVVTTVSKDRLNKGEKTPNVNLGDNASQSEEMSENSGDDQDGLWTIVSKKKPAIVHEATQKRAQAWNLTQEQTNLVREAKTQLTESEKGRIKARQGIPNRPDNGSSSESNEAGPSQDKGKVPDPRNWGGVDLDDEEIDIEAQKVALDSYRAACTEAEALEDEEEAIQLYKGAQEFFSDGKKKTRPLGGQNIPTNDLILQADAVAMIRAAEDRVQQEYDAYMREAEHERHCQLRASPNNQEMADFSPKGKRGKRKTTRQGRNLVENLVDQALDRSSDPRERRPMPKAMDPMWQLIPG